MPVSSYRAMLIATAAILFPATAASAQTLDEFAACAGIEADAARLACYDGLGAQLSLSADERRALTIAKAQEEFGLPAERRKDRAERLKIDHTVNAAITALGGGSGGQMIVTLDNGQVWRITSSGRLQQFLKPGMAVTISEGPISGYRLRTDAINGMETVRRID
jgi:hypothetical protein